MKCDKCTISLSGSGRRPASPTVARTVKPLLLFLPNSRDHLFAAFLLIRQRHLGTDLRK